MPNIFGTVEDDGSILNAGSGGWSAINEEPGVYTVTFATPFANAPVILLTCHADYNNTIATINREITTTYYMVRSHQGGAPENSAFHFLAFAADDSCE